MLCLALQCKQKQHKALRLAYYGTLRGGAGNALNTFQISGGATVTAGDARAIEFQDCKMCGQPLCMLTPALLFMAVVVVMTMM